METRIAELMKAMIEYDRGDALRIHHLVKVHNFASLIGHLEELEPTTLEVLEAAAVVHDIGIHVSEERYGSSAGEYQESEGPAEAAQLIKRVGGFTEREIKRICFLVNNHHTYTDIEGIDYQILVEADFLVNIYEDHLSTEAINKVRERIFRTRTGLELFDALYGGEPWKACPSEGSASCC